MGHVTHGIGKDDDTQYCPHKTHAGEPPPLPFDKITAKQDQREFHHGFFEIRRLAEPDAETYVYHPRKEVFVKPPVFG
ncbi:MAG TPA: hypothetical protein VJR68_16150 [Dyella sp.]|nr:hypothetical protein [Dyella sp.]